MARLALPAAVLSAAAAVLIFLPFPLSDTGDGVRNPAPFAASKGPGHPSTATPPTPSPATPTPAAAQGTAAITRESILQHRDAVLAVKHANFSLMMATSATMLAQLNHEADNPDESKPAVCPPEPHVAKHRHGCVKCSKYHKYVQNCNTTGTLFMDVRLPSFIHVMDTIARYAEFSPGLRILDWGAGCGTKLNYWRMVHGIEGVGLDYTTRAVHYSRAHSRPGLSFCWADGSSALKYIANNTYDRVVSHSALYHVMPVGRQCKVIREAVRITKPGGIIWFGHFRSGPALSFWKKGAHRVCPMPAEWNATVTTLRDSRIFGQHESWYTTVKALTVMVRKGAAPASGATGASGSGRVASQELPASGVALHGASGSMEASSSTGSGQHALGE